MHQWNSSAVNKTMQFVIHTICSL